MALQGRQRTKSQFFNGSTEKYFRCCRSRYQSAGMAGIIHSLIQKKYRGQLTPVLLLASEPFCVECAFFIRSFVGMRTEIIALCLYHIAGNSSLFHTVKVGDSAQERRHRYFVLYR